DPQLSDRAAHLVGVYDSRIAAALSGPPAFTGTGFLGFGFEREDSLTPSPYRFLRAERRIGWVAVIPNWAILLLFALVPGAWLLVRGLPIHRRARRRKQGRCLTCGYD